MFKYLFLFLIFGHGLIHSLGFLKAFDLIEISQLTGEISKPIGIIWGIVTMLFMATMTLFFLRDTQWALLAMITVVVSQVLIGMAWQDAKFGTFANLIIFTIAVAFYNGWRTF